MASKVNEISEQLAYDYVGFKLGKNPGAPTSLTAKTLRRLAADLERQHGDLFKNMLNSLNSPGKNTDTFQRIADEMFSDQVINWGRIAVLYTFAGHMAVHCENSNRQVESEKVAYWLSTFVNRKLSNWIVKAGGWDAFNEYFKESKTDNDGWWSNVLCTVGLVAGAAGAALVFAR